MQLTIALVGMPGSGKSTVGRYLARHLRFRFVDSDSEIERELGGPIRSYFETHGEPAFRDIEQRTITRLCQDSGPVPTSGEESTSPAGTQGHDPKPSSEGLVLATGGGSILRPANREALSRSAVVVYLRSSPEELFRRLRHDGQRPLLQVADPLRRLRELYRERDPLYRATSRYVIETGRPTVHTLVNMILMQLELAGLVDGQRTGTR